MDPASAIGVAAAVVQFLNLSIKVAKRINEYVQSSPGDVPKPLENIAITLPLITNSLSRLQDESNLAQYDKETQTILHGVVLGCLRLARELDDLSNKIALKPEESLGSKLKKVIHSLSSEERIQDIDRGLQAFIQVLVLHQVVNKKDVHLRPTKSTKYFEVKTLQVKDAMRREKLITRIHQAFANVVRGTTDKPVYLTLHGPPGTGKSQLALQYCHDSFSSAHYPAVFWLDASDPTSLRESLAAMSPVVRHSNTGSLYEKLEFARSFLASSWHPWLLVLDGYEPFSDSLVTDILPDSGRGAVITTSRTRAEITPDSALIEVYKPLMPAEAEKMQERIENRVANKDMEYLVDALNREFDPNTFTEKTFWSQPQPIINLAASVGFAEGVRLLLDLGADPGHDKAQNTALGNATHEGQLEIIEMLIDHENATGYRFEDYTWDLAFAGALRSNNRTVLELLLRRRIERWRPDWWRIGEGFEGAVENGHIEIMRYLVREGKFPTSKVILSNLLNLAAKENKTEMIHFLLEEAKADAREPDKFGETPLGLVLSSRLSRRVSQEQRRDLIRTFVKAGAEINSRANREGNTALHVAANSYVVSSMPLLFELGANALLLNDDKETPLQIAARQGHEDALPVLAKAPIADAEARREYLSNALFIAARKGYRELALEALNEADLNLREDGETALVVAIKNERLPMARMLVRKGADQTAADKTGKIPLMLAVEAGMDALVKDLVKAKDSPGVEVSNKQGFTPLQLAVKHRHLQTTAVLLQLGADKDALNDFGETAMDLAEESKIKQLIELLES